MFYIKGIDSRDTDKRKLYLERSAVRLQSIRSTRDELSEK